MRELVLISLFYIYLQKVLEKERCWNLLHIKLQSLRARWIVYVESGRSLMIRFTSGEELDFGRKRRCKEQ